MLALLPASASAQPSSLVSVTGQRGQNHPTFKWCLPNAAVQSEFIEVATSDEVGQYGYFLQKNVESFNVVGRSDTTFTDEFAYPKGRFYVHVGTHDRRVAANSESPAIEFSNVMSFDVLDPPNVVGTVGPCPVTGGGGGGGGGGVSDKVAPVVSLRFPRVQDIDKLYVKVHTSESARIKATGTVRVGKASKVYRFKRKTLTLAGNASTKVRLKLAKKSLRTVKRALKRKRLKAKITVTATDAAGNRRSKKATLRLKN
jgi:hypothetical protein